MLGVFTGSPDYSPRRSRLRGERRGEGWSVWTRDTPAAAFEPKLPVRLAVSPPSLELVEPPLKRP